MEVLLEMDFTMRALNNVVEECLISFFIYFYFFFFIIIFYKKTNGSLFQFVPVSKIW